MRIDAILLDDFKANSHDGISRLTPGYHPDVFFNSSRIGKGRLKKRTNKQYPVDPFIEFVEPESGFISVWLPCEGSALPLS